MVVYDFISELTNHLALFVSYVTMAIDAVGLYVPAFFGPEIGALVFTAASVALVMVVVGR